MTELDRQIDEILSAAKKGAIHQPYHQALHRISHLIKMCSHYCQPPHVLDQHRVVFVDHHNHQHSGILFDRSLINPLAFDAILRLPSQPEPPSESMVIESTLAVKKLQAEQYGFPSDSDKLKSAGLTVDWVLIQLVPLMEKTLRQSPEAQGQAFAEAVKRHPYLLRPARFIITI